MQLNYKYYTQQRNVRIQNNEMYESAIFGYIRLKFSNIFHLDVVYNIHPVFAKKNSNNNKMDFFFNFFEYFFFMVLKIQDSSSVCLAILRHYMQRNRLNFKNCVQVSDSCIPLFCIKIAWTDVTLT